MSFLLAGVTTTIGPQGYGLLGRLTYGDLFIAAMLASIVIFIVPANRWKVYLSEPYLWFIILLLVFLFSAVFALNNQKSTIEIVVHLFIFLYSLALVQLYVNIISKPMVDDAVSAAILGASFLAIYGIVILFLFPDRNVVEGGLAGSFRNTGQAGSYFLTMSAIAIPAILSGVFKASLRNWLLVGVIILALIFTGKRASLIGFFVGIVGLLLFMIKHLDDKKNRKMASVFLGVAMLTPFVVLYLILWGVDNVEGLSWRLEAKFTADGLDKFYTDFWSSNLQGAIEAFNSNPLIGVGLGNVLGEFHEFEIHSTYAAVLATAGILGVGVLFGFLVSLYKEIKANGFQNKYDKFLCYFMPFFLGLMVSWSYTYTLRKREFWLMIFLITIIKMKSRAEAYRQNHRSAYRS